MQYRVYNVYRYSLLLLLLQSLYAWFLWGTTVFVLLFTSIATFLLYFTFKGLFSFNKSNAITIILFIVLQIYVVIGANVNSQIGALLQIIIFTGVLLLKDQIKIDLFRFFSKAFAIILLVSLFGWILFLLGVPLPHNFTDSVHGEYDNYYVFLVVLRSSILVFPRFSSVFLEPGYLGMITSFLLIAHRFEIKKFAVLIILVATIFSFSLAAYVLLLITGLIYAAFNSKRPFRNSMIMCFIVFSVYLLFINLGNLENPFNYHIIGRLAFNDGEMVGYDRYTPDFNKYFENFMSTNDKYFGLGLEKFIDVNFFEGGNAGYKVYITVYGIAGTLLTFLFYISLVLSYNTRMAWLLLIAYVLVFIQAAYPLLGCELLIFITAVPMFKSIKYRSDYKSVLFSPIRLTGFIRTGV